jgi:hypothetical protein
MPIDLKVMLPNLAHTLDGSGFLFGAGSSVEAGYPLMPGLTRDVISGLKPDELADLDDALVVANEKYDATTGTPNIEQIADLVIAHGIASQESRFVDLERRLRDLVLQRILNVSNPNIEHHVRLFEALKRRAFGLPCCVWIFTTNYDLMFETAAAICGVKIENGFSGATLRFFEPSQLRNAYGTVAGHNFAPCTGLTVKLIKLHGSISWFEEKSRFYEQHPASLTSGHRRTLILPRRKKVMDTLVAPYDALFSLASKVIGAECKYLVSCGFNYADDHISDHLLLPAMNARKCSLFALSEIEPAGVASFKAMPNFKGGFAAHTHDNGQLVAGGTELWKFSNFIKLFE